MPKGMFEIQGEPEIVRVTRKKILDEFQDLEFYEDGHVYILNGNKLNSVSGIGNRFIREPFDEEYQSKRYAEKNGETPEYWLKQWHRKSFKATTLGTKTHEFGESLGYLRVGHPELIVPRIRAQYNEELNYLAPIHAKEEAVVSFMDNLPPSMHLVLNEARVYSGKNPDASKNLKEQICGTFDMLYYFDGNGDESKAGFVVLDYKTNEHLESEFNRLYHKFLLPPFDDMIEEDLSLYSIQLSLYALMLQDIGIPVINRTLVWLKEDGQFQFFSLPDVGDKLRDVL